MHWSKWIFVLGCAICCREAAPDRTSPQRHPPPMTAVDFEYVEPKALSIPALAKPTVDNSEAFGLASDTRSLRAGLRAMECFVEHEQKVEERKAPRHWQQPSFSTYENHPGDPCSLMPER